MASEVARSGKRLRSSLTPREDSAGTEAEPVVAVEAPVVEPMDGDDVSPEVGLSDWLLGNLAPVTGTPDFVPTSAWLDGFAGAAIAAAPSPSPACFGPADPAEVRSSVLRSVADFLM